MAATRSTTASPRTQAERTATSRQALLDAAAAQLLEGGLASVTAGAVAGRAGLSPGSVFNHFGDKAGMMGALVEHLSATMERGFVAAVEDIGPAEDRVGAAVQAVYELTMDPLSVASLELYTAARTDASLAGYLKGVNRAESAHHRELAALLFEDVDVDVELLGALANLLIFATLGMAVAHAPEPNPEAERQVLDLIALIASEAIGGEA
jgi:AcrR family transcriptional regulator